MKQEKPVLVVFAGPNGSGKSSITNEAFQVAAMPSIYINADDMTKEKLGGRDRAQLGQAQLDHVNVEAANEADRQRQEAMRAGQSFATETVMSTPAKIELMREAKANGYHVHLIYVTTQDPEINVGRVLDRVEKGGHAVPPEKTKARYQRAMQLLMEAVQVTDTAKIYNNSFDIPILIMEKTSNNEIKPYSNIMSDMYSKWVTENVEKVKQDANR